MDGVRGPVQKFAVSLFQACRKEYPTGNLLYSPLTASSGLLMILLGSDGKTRSQIENAMRLEDSCLFSNSSFEDDLQMAYRHVLALLHKNPTSNVDNEDYGAFRAFRVNKLFVDAGVTLRDDFLKRIEKLRGEISFIDFRRNPVAARHEMNDYVEERMNGKAPEIGSGLVTASTQMVLINGICFRARWELTFDPKLTQKQPFYNIDGKSSSTVEMMTGTFHVPYFDDYEAGLTFFEIPYAGNSASLLILLPMKRYGLADLSKELNLARFNKINLQKRLREICVTIPKFSVRNQVDLKQIFLKMGCTSLFADGADLGRMTADNLSLSAAVHNAYFTIDENGTDARDTVDRGVKAPAASPSAGKKVPTVLVDHPFLFTVRHNKSGIMVCLGRVENL